MRRSMAEFAALLESGAVVEKLPPPTAQSARRLQPADDRTLQQLDEVTLAAAKSARDYRVWMLENQKNASGGAPDSGNAVAGVNPAPTIADPRAEKRREQEVGGDTPTLEPQLAGEADKAIADGYRAKAVELINANVNATLSYAQQLGAVRSAAEFIELSTRHAHRHLELIMKHAAGFTALSGTPAAKARPTNNGVHRVCRHLAS